MPRFRIEPTVIFGGTRIQLCKERLDGVCVNHRIVEECEALVALTSLDNKVIYAREDNVPELIGDSRPLSWYNAGFNISGDELGGNWDIGFLLAFEV